MHFEVYSDASDEWRWRLIAENNRIVATSGESYTARHNCLDAITLVVSADSNTPVKDE